MKIYLFSFTTKAKIMFDWLMTKRQRSYLEIIGIQNIEYPSYNAKELCNKFTGYESVN